MKSMKELKRLDPNDEKAIDLFARAIYMGVGLPFYSEHYPAYRFLPERIKKDMQRMGKAAYKEFIKMVEGYNEDSK